MKRFLCLIILVVSGAVRMTAAETVAEIFREGLFEEEANRDLPAAIEAYQEVVQRLDEQRRLAATAIFRLGECHRKLGQDANAIAAYERVLREFPDEEILIQLSRESLSILRPAPASAYPSSTLTSAAVESVRQEMKLVEQQLALAEVRYKQGVSDRAAILPLKRALLRLQRQLPENADRERQIALFEEELASAEEALSYQRTLEEAGQAAPDKTFQLKRELLVLQRELAAIQRGTMTARSDPTAVPDPLTTEEAEEIKRIQVLVANSPDLINAATAEAGNTRLMNAAGKGQLVVARYLLDHGARVNGTGAQNRTALHEAVVNGHLRMAELLIEHGADVNAVSDSGSSPLHSAASRGYLTLADFLLSQGANINAVVLADNGRQYSGPPLGAAVNSKQLAMVKFLLDKGADPNLASMHSRTPLTWARSTELIRLLLEHGADPRLDGATRLLRAVAEQDLEGLRLLLEHRADPNAFNRTKGEYSPLFPAIKAGRADMVRLLLEANADVNVVGPEGQTALAMVVLQIAGRAATLDTTETEQPAGSVTAETAAHMNALHVRSRAPSAEIRELLKSDEPDWQILHLLVSGGANVSVVINGWKPIHYLSSLGQIADLQLMEDHGASVNAIGLRKVTPLMIAVCNERFDIVDWLLENGAEVEAQNEDGHTVLHLAAYHRSLPMVKKLLKHGASTSAKGKVPPSGQTPFQLMRQGSTWLPDRFGIPVATRSGNRLGTQGTRALDSSPAFDELLRLLMLPESTVEIAPSP